MTLSRTNFSALLIVALSCLPFFSCRVPHGFHPDDIPKNMVNITNFLAEGTPLAVHCRSGDEDFGEHVLRYTEYTFWEFRPSLISKSTLFWCSMKWQRKDGWVEGTFYVYRETRDYERCATKCDWLIQVSGAMVYDQQLNKYVVDYIWP